MSSKRTSCCCRCCCRYWWHVLTSTTKAGLGRQVSWPLVSNGMWVAWHRQALKGGTVGLMVMLVVVVVMMVGMRARGGRAQRMVRAAGGHIKAAGHAEGGGGGEGLVRHLGRARVQQCGAHVHEQQG